MSGTDTPRDEREVGARYTPGWTRIIGVGLLALAVLMWAASAVLVFLPLTGTQKVWSTSALLVGGEVVFWISAVFLGRELFRRYRSRFDPRRLFGRRKG